MERLDLFMGKVGSLAVGARAGSAVHPPLSLLRPGRGEQRAALRGETLRARARRVPLCMIVPPETKRLMRLKYMGSKAWLAPHLDRLLGDVAVLHSPFFGSGKLEYYLAAWRPPWRRVVSTPRLPASARYFRARTQGVGLPRARRPAAHRGARCGGAGASARPQAARLREAAWWEAAGPSEQPQGRDRPPTRRAFPEAMPARIGRPWRKSS